MMHTKGPWELERSITSLGYARVKLILNEHGTIGFVNMWRDAEEEAQANARLIATAPDLYTVVDMLVNDTADLDLVIEAGRKAIRKAKEK